MVVGFVNFREEIIAVADPVQSANIEETASTINSQDIYFETKLETIDLGKMKTSWYGPVFHGRLTANGEIFDQMSFTAAHKSMPFGTLLKITNPLNGKSTIVRINDRGPYIHGRDLDISKAAAEEIGLIQKGVKNLLVEQIVFQNNFSPILSLN